MRIRPRLAALATIPALMLATGIATATAASASTGPGAVTAVTHTQNHADTTSVHSACTDANEGPNGPVWAYDNLSLRFTAVPDGSDTYQVTITAHGSFSAICNPVTGDAWTGNGAVDGWLKYEVQSTTPPDPGNLPAQSPGDRSQGTLLNDFFGGNATIVGGGSYYYVYNNIPGVGKYVQVG